MSIYLAQSLSCRSASHQKACGAYTPCLLISHIYTLSPSHKSIPPPSLFYYSSLRYYIRHPAGIATAYRYHGCSSEGVSHLRHGPHFEKRIERRLCMHIMRCSCSDCSCSDASLKLLIVPDSPKRFQVEYGIRLPWRIWNWNSSGLDRSIIGTFSGFPPAR